MNKYDSIQTPVENIVDHDNIIELKKERNKDHQKLVNKGALLTTFKSHIFVHKCKNNHKTNEEIRTLQVFKGN